MAANTRIFTWQFVCRFIGDLHMRLSSSIIFQLKYMYERLHFSLAEHQLIRQIENVKIIFNIISVRLLLLHGSRDAWRRRKAIVDWLKRDMNTDEYDGSRRHDVETFLFYFMNVEKSSKEWVREELALLECGSWAGSGIFSLTTMSVELQNNIWLFKIFFLHI